MAAVLKPVPLPVPLSPVLAQSALAILLPRRNSGEPAVRVSCRALIRRWVAVLRGVA